MPGISGAELLNQVMKRYPATNRIILSGQADQEDVWRSVGATHLYLEKPFSIPTLVTTLNRMRGLKQRLPSREIQELIGKKGALPSVPVVYFNLLEALGDPNLLD